MCSWHCFGGPGYSWSILQGSHGSRKVLKNEKKIQACRSPEIGCWSWKTHDFLLWYLCWNPDPTRSLTTVISVRPPAGVSSHADSLNTASTKSHKRSWSPCESVNSHLVEECYLKVSAWLRARTRHCDVDTGDLAWQQCSRKRVQQLKKT